MASVLVSGIGKRNALLGLLRDEFNSKGLDLAGADAAANPPARIGIRPFFQLPKATDRGFERGLVDALLACDARAYLTLIDPEITAAGLISESGRLGNALFAHPSFRTASLCEDKLAFSDTMKRAGVSCIESHQAPLAAFPQICKDRRGSAASGFEVLKETEDLKQALALQKARGADLIFQKYCDGAHYCIDAYFSLHTQQLVDWCAKKVLNKQAGESYLLKSERPDRFEAIIRKVAAELPMRGMVNFDVYDDAGQLSVMEVNCRIGGNYPASHAFGCNLLRHLAGEIADATYVANFNPSDYKANQVVAMYFEFTNPAPAPDWTG